MKKIFAFDMDGTILDDNDNVKEETLKALDEMKKKGHVPVIATGRPFDDAIRSLKEAANYFEYIVCNNGAYNINVETQEVDEMQPLPKEPIMEGIRIGREHNCFMAIHGNRNAQRTFLGDTQNVDWDSENFKEFKKFKDDFVAVEEILKWADSQHVRQFSLRATPEIIDEIKPQFDKFKDVVDIHIANTYYLDLNPKGATKWEGLLKLSKKLDVNEKDIIVFGDSGNDLQMLEHAGLGVCMGNGSDDAKAVSDVIIGDNNSDAIAKKITELIND